jgi:glyoxylase-like metal-dependent hydrolase (beta-lactamase superfamily II)
MNQIAPNTFASTEYAGSNVGFFAMPSGVIAIDAPVFPSDARAWRERILEATGTPILYLVLTDAHPDRMLSASLLGAPIVAARGAYEQAAAYTDGFWRSVADRWVRRFPEAAGDLSASRVAMPEIMFTRGLTLHKGGEGVTLHAVSGASPGSSWLHLPREDVLFAGDTVVAGVHPYVASAPDTRAWLETLRALRRPRFSQTTIVPGRGPICDGSATQALSDYIVLARRRVRSLHKTARPRGDTAAFVSELVSQFPIPGGERDWIQRRVRASLDRLYDELGEE